MVSIVIVRFGFNSIRFWISRFIGLTVYLFRYMWFGLKFCFVGSNIVPLIFHSNFQVSILKPSFYCGESWTKNKKYYVRIVQVVVATSSLFRLFNFLHTSILHSTLLPKPQPQPSCWCYNTSMKQTPSLSLISREPLLMNEEEELIVHES